MLGPCRRLHQGVVNSRAYVHGKLGPFLPHSLGTWPSSRWASCVCRLECRICFCTYWNVLTYDPLSQFTQKHGSLLGFFAASGKRSRLGPAPRSRCPETAPAAGALRPREPPGQHFRSGRLRGGEGSSCLQHLPQPLPPAGAPQMGTRPSGSARAERTEATRSEQTAHSPHRPATSPPRGGTRDGRTVQAMSL